MIKNNWKLIGGDVSFLDYGGFLLDISDVKRPQLEQIVPDNTEGEIDDNEMYTVYRLDVDRGKFKSKDGYHREWFMERDKLLPLCESCDCNPVWLAKTLLSRNPVERAYGYVILVQYHGAFEFDSYPERYTRKELIERYGDDSAKFWTAEEQVA